MDVDLGRSGESGFGLGLGFCFGFRLRFGLGFCGAGDYAGSTAESEVFEAPLDEDLDAALEFDYVHQVDEEPDEPGHDACYVNAEDVGDGGSATDYGHIAFVEIVEWIGFRLAVEAGEDKFGGVAAFLDSGLGYARDEIAVFGLNVSEIAGHENIREIGNGEVGKNFYFSGLIGWGGSAFG